MSYSKKGLFLFLTEQFIWISSAYSLLSNAASLDSE